MTAEKTDLDIAAPPATPVASPRGWVGRPSAAALKARVDILDIVSAHVQMEHAGRSHRGLCPFHTERTPSFHVDRERQSWHCFGCGEGGDVFTFVQRMERVDFRGALAVLARHAGVEALSGPDARRRDGPSRDRLLSVTEQAQAFYEHVLWSTPAGEPGRRLLAERAVSAEVARRFGLGFAPGLRDGLALVTHLGGGHASSIEACAAGLALLTRAGSAIDRLHDRLVFPFRDESGAVVGFAGRATDAGQPRYLNTPGTTLFDKSRTLFGIDLARSAIISARVVVVVEGYFDAVACHAAGIDTTVALGGTALTTAHATRLAQLAERVVLCLDRDAAGRAAAARATPLLAATGVEVRLARLPPDVKDADDLARRDPAALAEATKTAPPAWQVYIEEAIGPALTEGGVEERVRAAKRAVAVLQRIPAAAEREVYAGDAAERLGIRPAALLMDAAHAGRRRSGGVGPPTVSVDPPAREPPFVEALRRQTETPRLVPGQLTATPVHDTPPPQIARSALPTRSPTRSCG